LKSCCSVVGADALPSPGESQTHNNFKNRTGPPIILQQQNNTFDVLVGKNCCSIVVIDVRPHRMGVSDYRNNKQQLGYKILRKP
jgi:hypothetical protein